MNGTSVRIELDSLTVAAGENLTGRVLTDSSAFAQAPAGKSAPDARLTLELLWRTTGLSKAEEKVVATQTLTPSSAQGTPFQLGIPAAGPISYVGKTFSITWWVRVASLAAAETAFTVAPASRKAASP